LRTIALVHGEVRSTEEDYGAVVTLARGEYGGDSNIYSTYQGAFAAVLQDGTIVTSGDSNFGGDWSSVSAALAGVDMICSTLMAFPVALQDGTVVLYQRRWWVLIRFIQLLTRLLQFCEMRLLWRVVITDTSGIRVLYPTWKNR